MRTLSRVLPLIAIAAAAAAHSVQAQTAHADAGSVAQIRDNRFKWFFGAQAGALLFETQAQTQTGVPAMGAHLSIVNRRGGLMLGVDEAFGNNEQSAFLDEGSGGIARPVTFDQLRRYQFSLTGYPVRGSLEPYLGLGFGVLQIINPEAGGVFTSPQEAATAANEVHDISASGFVSFLAGVQFRVGRLAAFGQYQINTSASAGNLLRGPGHSIMGGLRFSLGSWKEGVGATKY